MSTIYDPRYIKIIEHLKHVRLQKQITQQTLANTLNQAQSYVSKIEGQEQRLDIIELYDWLKALAYEPTTFFRDIGWFAEERPEKLDALPVSGKIEDLGDDCNLILAWQGKEQKVLLKNVQAKSYLSLEKKLCELFGELNKGVRPNREAICEGLELCFSTFPLANPSDLYHHIVYRLYLREYTKTTAKQSWVRAGGEALELFIERHYSPILAPKNVVLKALITRQQKTSALAEMGLSGKVGDSKLDIALYGITKGKKYIFGGIHSKASFAERVSDDVPCSEAMMSENLSSFLFTLDAKSFPPPAGDLVNRGELGTLEKPSDKRKYIEEHGSFDACFCYNTRSLPSGGVTKSGKRIYVSSFDNQLDPMPSKIIEAWERYKKSRKLE